MAALSASLSLIIILLVKHTEITSASVEVSGRNFWLATRCFSNNCLMDGQGTQRSRIHCASICAKNSSCAGFQYDQTSGLCVHLQPGCFFLDVTCIPPAHSEGIYEKNPCGNDGIWDKKMFRCDCVGGWVGTYCERYPYNCTELFTYRYPVSAVDTILDIYRNGSLLSQVMCQIVPGNTIFTYLMRTNGTQEHNRTWADYVNGYNINYHNSWSGLEAMHELNKQNHDNLFIQVIFSDGVEIRRAQCTYYNFQLAGASQGYAFTYSTYAPADTGTLGSGYNLVNLLTPSSGCSFSTADRDNDGDSLHNCAARAGAGWWFCGCNPNLQNNVLGWSYAAIPGQTTDGHILLPNLDMWIPVFADNFKVVNMVYVVVV